MNGPKTGSCTECTVRGAADLLRTGQSVGKQRDRNTHTSEREVEMSIYGCYIANVVLKDYTLVNLREHS